MSQTCDSILIRFLIAHSIAQMVPNRGISPENQCSDPKLSDSFQTGRVETGSIRNPMLYPFELRALNHLRQFTACFFTVFSPNAISSFR